MKYKVKLVCLLMITGLLIPVAGFSQHSQHIEKTIPLYRMKGQQYQNHFYTTSALEKKAFFKKGYKDEGIIGRVYSKPSQGKVPLVRLYNQSEKNHFYTAHPKKIWEPLTTRSYSSYVYKGVVGYVFKDPQKGHIPLYRIRNKSLKKHFYTTNEDEYNTVRVLINDYKDEGIECYILPK